MRPVQIAVLRNHLRLKPEAEFHAHGIDLFRKAGKVGRQLLQVHIPVAEAGVVIVSLSKPAVIQDQHLYAQVGRLRCDLQYVLFVKIEICGFPVINQDGASCIFIFSSADMVADDSVEVMGQLRKTAA